MTSRTPRVSVIVAAYNVTAYITETLDSLRRQTFRDFETIVVNDGCPDTAGLERVLEPYRNEIKYLKQPNGGVASARNTAILASSAPLVASLDADDTWEPEYLDTQVGILTSTKDIDIVYPDAVIFGSVPIAGKTFMELFPSSGEVTFQSLCLRQCYVFTGVTARREVIIRAGLYDPRWRLAEDFDLWLRLAAMGARFAYHKRPLVRYRVRPNSLSQNSVWMTRSVVQVCENLLATLELSASDRQAAEHCMTTENAYLDLCLGKKAVYSSNRQEALERLSSANRVLRRRKISVALWMLRLVPHLLYRYVHRRHATEDSFLGLPVL